MIIYHPATRAVTPSRPPTADHPRRGGHTRVHFKERSVRVFRSHARQKESTSSLSSSSSSSSSFAAWSQLVGRCTATPTSRVDRCKHTARPLCPAYITSQLLRRRPVLLSKCHRRGICQKSTDWDSFAKNKQYLCLSGDEPSTVDSLSDWFRRESRRREASASLVGSRRLSLSTVSRLGVVDNSSTSSLF